LNINDFLFNRLLLFSLASGEVHVYDSMGGFVVSLLLNFLEIFFKLKTTFVVSVFAVDSVPNKYQSSDQSGQFAMVKKSYLFKSYLF